MVQKSLEKQETLEEEVTITSLTSFDMWAIGITIVIGGQYFAWNEGLSAGVGSNLISLILVSIGYICLVYCVTELSSGLPFAGGNYGLARVTAGIFPGYLVGCYDALVAIIYVATSVVGIGSMITISSGLSSSFEPLY
jgi:ethanolamine permease